jgi:hypothetical protein
VSSASGPVSIVTFIDPSKVRRKRDPGRCFRRAGFIDIGRTRGGLWALGLHPQELPDPTEPAGSQGSLQLCEAPA